jgi:hypothetical protein
MKLFEDDGTKKLVVAPPLPRTNGTATAEDAEPESNRSHPAWSDGTIQVGTIRLDGHANGAGAGGGLTDEELERRLRERMRDMDHDETEDGGMHL